MMVIKTIRIPIHYRTTKSKLYRLDRLTARITYCSSLINSLVTKLPDERNTPNMCHCCGNKTGYEEVPQWGIVGSMLLLPSKVDTGINAAYNMALRFRDDRLKV